jgi:ribosomal protein S18 acetylase RimI-like enzyme
VTAPTIRPAEPSDLGAMYDICFRTSAAGDEPTGDEAPDPQLLGHHYVGPYLALEPDLAFVAVDEAGVGGYVVGTADTRAFEARLEVEWYPPLRQEYPEGTGDGYDAILVALLHHVVTAADDVVATHPAHLHIDLLPRLQGRGVGRRLMDTMHDACRARGATGLHLGVSPQNRRAVGFYRHLGYEVLREDDFSVTLGLDLPT